MTVKTEPGLQAYSHAYKEAAVLNRCGLFYVLYKSDKKKQNNLEHKTIYISLVKW